MRVIPGYADCQHQYLEVLHGGYAYVAGNRDDARQAVVCLAYGTVQATCQSSTGVHQVAWNRNQDSAMKDLSSARTWGQKLWEED